MKNSQKRTDFFCHVFVSLFAAVLALGASACGDAASDTFAGESDACEQASAHYEDCTGEALAVDACSEDAASEILATSCDELESVKNGGKGDSFLSNLLCEVSVKQCNFDHVEAGFNFNCGLLENGRVRCWGNDSSEDIGNSVVRTAPLSDVFERIKVSNNIACAQAPQGYLKCWGHGFGAVGRKVDVEDITIANYEKFTLGSTFVCGLLASGNYECFDSEGFIDAGPDVQFEQLSAYGQKVCGVSLDGDAHCWTTSEKSSRTPIEPPEDKKFERVYPGSSQTCALDEEGAVTCWNNWEPVGTLDPLRVPTPEGRFFGLEAGGGFFCGVTRAYRVRCFGFDEGGTVHNSPADTGRFRHTSAGEMHACAVNTDGKAECWGRIMY